MSYILASTKNRYGIRASTVPEVTVFHAPFSMADWYPAGLVNVLIEFVFGFTPSRTSRPGRSRT
jgi:hypothetical protein